jgi:putative transcriptional regulator
VEGQVRVEVRKIQVFSRIARGISVLVMGLMGLGVLVMFLGILFEFRAVKVSFGPFLIEGSRFTTLFLKAWGVLFCSLIFGFVFRWLYLLFSLFDSLAEGSIYTAANVRRIRARAAGVVDHGNRPQDAGRSRRNATRSRPRGLTGRARAMPVIVNLDVMLARRKMRLNELSERVGITPQNLSVLKTGRAKAIRFSTLEKLCEVLECQPGDLFAFEQ